jgi:hypothetical protein
MQMFTEQRVPGVNLIPRVSRAFVQTVKRFSKRLLFNNSKQTNDLCRFWGRSGLKSVLELYNLDELERQAAESPLGMIIS